MSVQYTVPDCRASPHARGVADPNGYRRIAAQDAALVITLGVHEAVTSFLVIA